jgi:hypothetical protein
MKPIQLLTLILLELFSITSFAGDSTIMPTPISPGSAGAATPQKYCCYTYLDFGSQPPSPGVAYVTSSYGNFPNAYSQTGQIYTCPPGYAVTTWRADTGTPVLGVYCASIATTCGWFPFNQTNPSNSIPPLPFTWLVQGQWGSSTFQPEVTCN